MPTKRMLTTSGQMDMDEVNLRRCPHAHGYHITHVVFGDLHANAVKLVYNLIRNGICAPISDASYDELLAIYDYTPPLTKAYVHSFELWMRRHFKVIDTTVMVHLIGDVLADRGRNDWFTLKILEALKHNGVCVRIVFSNHDCLFFDAMGLNGEIRKREAPRALEKNRQGNSHLELMQAFEDGVFLADDIKALVLKAYLPSLLMMDYFVGNDKKMLTIVSHAPTDLTGIEQLANVFCVPYDGSIPNGLVRTINAMNSAFKAVVQAERTHEFFVPGMVAFDALWTREQSLYQARGEQETRAIPGITFIYGHDKKRDVVPKNVIRLDNHIGKGCLESYGEMEIGYLSNSPWPDVISC